MTTTQRILLEGYLQKALKRISRDIPTNNANLTLILRVPAEPEAFLICSNEVPHFVYAIVQTVKSVGEKESGREHNGAVN